jgi:hypothetical protein
MRAARPSLLLSLCAVVVVAAGACPGPVGEGEGEGEGEAGEGEGEAGEGEGEAGEGEGEEGEGEPPPPPPDNDLCGAAKPLTSGVSESGTTLGATDQTPCADADFFEPTDENGGDVVYAFTLGSERGVEIVLEGEFDGVLSLFAEAEGCGEVEDLAPDGRQTCVDATFDGAVESIRIGAVAPGNYFIVVESFAEGGDFDITFTELEPFCEGDANDLAERADADGNEIVGDETPETAFLLSRAAGNQAFTGNADTANPEDPTNLHLCDGDVDYHLIGHMGGVMTLAATAGVVEVRVANVDVEGSIAANSLLYTEGDVVAGLPGVDVDVPAGFYLIKVTEDAVLTGAQNVAYDLAVSHACVGDAFDLPLTPLDLGFEEQQEPTALPLDEPLARSLCADDVDLFAIDVLFEGQLVLTYGGDVGRDVVIDVVSVDSAGVETPVVDVVRVDDEANNTLTFTLEAVPGLYRVTASAPGQISTGAYTFNVTLPGLDGVPANDTCAAATELVDGVAAGGRTVGATDDDRNSFCGFTFGEVPTHDVFFRFTLVGEADVEVEFEPLRDYGGSVTVYTLPSTGCPADLADLVPVGGVDEPACVQSFNPEPLRLPGLPAGDYLVLVDDSIDFFDEVSLEGLFKVTYRVFPDGFPPPAACLVENIDAVDISLGGTLEFAAADFFAGEIDGELCRQAGNEKVLSFVAPQNGTLVARTQQLEFDDGDFDTVLTLRETCDDPTDEQCDDDGPFDVDEFDSLLEAEVVAGVTYFLIVDGFSDGAPAADQRAVLELAFTAAP